MPNRKPERAFPFPFAEDEAQTRWWNGLHPVEKKRLFGLLAAMTPEERRAFQQDRLETIRTHDLTDNPWDRFQRQRQDHHATALYDRWAKAVRARQHAAKAEQS